MKIFLAFILIGLPPAYSVYQCYQCSHTEDNPDLDCVSVAEQYLRNCTADAEFKRDLEAESFKPILPDALINLKQDNQWTCRQSFVFSPTKLSLCIRECIPKLDIEICTSNGSLFETNMECICNTEGCNNFVVVSTPLLTTTSDIDDTTPQMSITMSTTEADTGGSKILFPLSVLYYFLIFCIFGIF